MTCAWWSCFLREKRSIRGLPSAYRERHVEDGDLLRAPVGELHLALRRVKGVEDRDDLLEGRAVVAEEDALVELAVRGIAVAALLLPLLFDLLREVGVADDLRLADLLLVLGDLD